MLRRARRGSNKGLDAALLDAALVYHPIDEAKVRYDEAAEGGAPSPCGVLPAQALKLLGQVPWFHNLTNTELRRLFKRCHLTFFRRGACVLRENTRGSAFMLLIEGRLFAHSKRREIDHMIVAGTSFGEAALASECGARREAVVYALDDSW